MILTVTLNPLLERRFYYPSIKMGEENRNGEKKLKSGGKGINVSRQLNCLEVENLAYTFLGGTNGKILRDVLSEEKINFSFIKTKTETREAAIIIDKSKESVNTFFSDDQNISKEEVEVFKNKLEKIIQNCEIVIFAGSSPKKSEFVKTVFPFGINIANKLGKISICDTYGEHLKKCIDSGPTIIHNNVLETEKSLNISLRTEEEKIKYLDQLHKKNIKQVFLTNGKNPSYASNFDFKYKVENPKIKTLDPTGSGDSFTAGVAYGWHNNLPFNETLIFSSALGAANAKSFEISNVPFSEIEKLENKIKISSIGKTLKIIDDTPQ